MTIPRRKPYFASGSLLIILKSLFRNDYLNFTKKLERKLSDELKIPNPIMVASGRVGLSLILKNAKLKPKSEIILPVYTFGPLVKIIEDEGFISRPVDIDPDTFQMSLKSIKKAINKNTGAIIATHLFGEICDVKNIVKLAKLKRLLVIEDCAQALGATKNGKPVGTFGDISISSFNIAKPLQGISGGLIYGNNIKIINRIKKEIIDSSFNNKSVVKDILRGVVGMILNQTIFWPVLMYIISFKLIQNMFVKLYRLFETKSTSHVLLNPILSKIIYLNLKDYQKRLRTRREIRSTYAKKLNKYLTFQKTERDELGSVDMVVAKTRIDVYKVRRFLALRGIDVAIKDEVADLCKSLDNKIARRVYDKLIALPIYESLTIDDINRVSSAIVKLDNER